MFGYSAGAAPQVLADMIAERAPARSRWPFLTTLDLSTIHNEKQLISIVKDRTGETLAEAQHDVRRWLEGYRARVAGGALQSKIARQAYDGEAPVASRSRGNVR